jgi:hypothetical protein
MNPFKRSADGMFASVSLLGHLLRGAIGVALTVFAIDHQTSPALALLAIGAAIFAFRGCPMCWTIGLVETIIQVGKQRSGC